MRKKVHGLRRALLPRAWGNVTRGLLEQLESRVLLSGTVINAGDFLPPGDGIQYDYLGADAENTITSGAKLGPMVPASANMTTKATTQNGLDVSRFDTSITYSNSDGPQSVTDNSRYIGLDGKGLEIYGENYVGFGTPGPIRLLNTTANVGDVYSFANGSSTVVGWDTVTLGGYQKVSAIVIVVNYVARGSSSTNSDYSTTWSANNQESFWLAPGLGIVQFCENIDYLETDYTQTGLGLQIEYDNVVRSDFFTRVPLAWPAKLEFIQAPGDAPANQPISPSIAVALLDGNGDIFSNDDTPIILRDDSSDPGAVLDSVQPVNGIATFDNLTLTDVRLYKLTATDGVYPPVSSSLNSTTLPDVSISNGQVVIAGSTGSDTIAAGVDPSDSTKDYFLVRSAGQPQVIQLYPTSSVNGLLIDCDPSGATAPSINNDDLVNLGGESFGFPVTINGGAGSDTIIGQQDPNDITTATGSSRNLVYGGPGSDTLTSNGDYDTVRGGGAHDTIASTGNYGLLAGGKDGSNLTAGNYDTLMGGLGNATLDGGQGNGLIIGGFGNDLINARNNEVVIAGSGQSTLVGTFRGGDFLDAGFDAFLRFQGQGPLPAPSGSDSVTAGALDTLVSNSGSPTMDVGGNVSTFDVNNASATLLNVGIGSFVAQNDTIASATQTITVHLSIQVVENGITHNVAIPQGSGAAPSGISAAQATDANGTVIFQSNGPRTFTLADFFDHWGVDFGAHEIGQFIVSLGSASALDMTVNGVANSQFNNYAVQNGDNIVITLTQ